MIKKVSKVSYLPNTGSYKGQNKEEQQKKQSARKGDFSKTLQEEIKKLR